MRKTPLPALWLAALLATGCSTALFSPRQAEIKKSIARAEYLAGRGDFQAAISTYEQALGTPSPNPWRDKALFDLGCLHAAANNPDRDFDRSLACFRRLKQDHPLSRFNAGAEVWVGLLEEIVSLEEEIRAGRAELTESRLLLEQESARLEAERREREASQALQAKKVKELEGLVDGQKAALENLERQLKKMKEIDIQAEKKAKGIK